MGRQRTEAKFRARFCSTEARPPASHALWSDKTRCESRSRISKVGIGFMNITRTRILTLALTLCFSVQIVAFAADRAVAHDSDYDYDPPVPGTYALPVIKVAPDGAIIDSAGQASNLRELTHGRITVLSFIYTRCAAPKACPYATGVLYDLHALSAGDEGLSRNMRLVSLSFDPDYLQFCHPRSAPRPSRCENLVTRRREAFEEVTHARAATRKPAKLRKRKRRSPPRVVANEP